MSAKLLMELIFQIYHGKIDHHTPNDLIWRYTNNPIIPRDLILSSNSIFNSAVVYKDNSFFGVFRCDDKARNMTLHKGHSKDGINWNIDNETIKFICDEPNQ